MKKILFILPLALVLLTSCVEKIGPMGPMGPQGPAGEGCYVKHGYIDVPERAWRYVSEGGYYIAEISDLGDVVTESVFDNAMIKLYRCYPYLETDQDFPDSQIELPSVIADSHYVTYPDNPGTEYLVNYTQNLDYELSYKGVLTLFYTHSDFAYPGDFNPGAMSFKLVLVINTEDTKND